MAIATSLGKVGRSRDWLVVVGSYHQKNESAIENNSWVATIRAVKRFKREYKSVVTP
jgi:hypothetical protein